MAGTVLELFERSASRIVLPEAATVTAATIAERGRAVAGALTERGLRPGDRVAVWMANGAEYLVALAAAAAGRYVAVSVNTRFSPAEAADLITRSGSVALFTDAATDGTRPDGVAVLDPAVLAATGSLPTEAAPSTDDHFVVFTTSGTTGPPKMAVHTQRSITVHAHDAAAGFGLGADDVVLAAMPLCGTFGLTTLTSALAADATIVLPDRFDAAGTADLLHTHGVTVTQGSDDMFHRLLEHGADLGGLRVAGHARFNASLDDIVTRADRAGAPLVGLYGMSEVQALFAHRDPAADRAVRARPGGRPVSGGARVRIVDGELRLRGPSLFAGYLAPGGDSIDEELTAAHFDEGWFRTGDLAEPDPDDDRAFTFLSRMGDAMRLGGFLVAPTEIEAAVLALDGVADAQVVAVDRPSGTRPVAFVVPEPGAPPLDHDAARAACATRLARHKVPVRFHVVDAFPTTDGANGTKIRRHELRRLATEILAADPEADSSV